jgi:hypothetical protein
MEIELMKVKCLKILITCPTTLFCYDAPAGDKYGGQGTSFDLECEDDQGIKHTVQLDISSVKKVKSWKKISVKRRDNIAKALLSTMPKYIEIEQPEGGGAPYIKPSYNLNSWLTSAISKL